MNIRYEILTEVQFEHEYFNGIFSVFKVMPNAFSRRVLANFGLEFREYDGRFFIYFDVFHGGTERSRADLLCKDLHLAFYIKLIDQQFFNYTSPFEMELGKEVFYFSNSKVDREFLHHERWVSNQDLYPYSVRFLDTSDLIKPFGILVLKVAKGLRLTYGVRFEAMATYWRYILVSDYLKAIPNPIVIDKETQQVFSGPETITLPSGATSICFVSPEPIKLSSKAVNRYQLLQNSADGMLKGRVVIRSLQNPNHTYLSRLSQGEEAKTKRNYSEIII